ncbi:MAG: UDP-N-acetylmuramoyl-L-alanyl-D-glutamate--2,6-diaminopimelate ligase [Oleispira antarctica]|nr:UDP-N-acetylmuramoyl-L-alanyl-D-glutamate--2,6-diaminopimelate ligase [Oleispira antarctica]MBQ0792653.1 UDP-N-acetylmuramoyl-L-alanyl-D-glutamate--2,6-diaminopimelate ligase [Oleispira antarctica]
MNLIQLLAPYIGTNAERPEQVALSTNIPDVSIQGLVTDNRDVKAGDCFIALAGITQHGKVFIDDAIAHGAVAVLLDVEENPSITYRSDTPIIAIRNLKAYVNKILIDFYQLSGTAFDMRLMSVTGTNGKSSITRFAAQMSHSLQQSTGLMGTLGFGVWPNITESKNTTPELAVLLRQFAMMKTQGAKQVAMEVSSHGIEQKRIEGLTFETAVFSNLSQDHLDYHGDMESYFSIKRELFLLPKLQYAIINADDEYGQRLLADEKISAKKISYGFSKTAEVRVVDWVMHSASIDASITSPWGDASFTINMVGDFNLANVLAAISMLAVDEKFSFAEIINSIECITAAPGRMQVYIKENCANAVVDFAHTPDALENVLATLKKQTQGRLAVVFGCGGNRDAGKRPQMTRIAQAFADRIVLTADNPRKENLQNIIKDMQSDLDISNPTLITIELDRKKAIELVLAELNNNDLLLIAGKGHEAYQDIDGVKISYSDEATLLSLGYQNIAQDTASIELIKEAL